MSTSTHPLPAFTQRPTLPFDLGSLGVDWKLSAAPDGSPFAAFGRKIETSQNDARQYRLIVLRNGLEALLVSDPTLDKAAVSCSVGVGHLSDPDDLPGLAHFCEHMLFLGTEKFPDEAAYKLFLSQHSGSGNASTSTDETNFHASFHPSAIPGDEGFLARHSQFFTAPLFLASCTERELKAVDSEFRRNLLLDSRRLFMLGKATSNRDPGAVYWKFGTGSRETLWDEPVAKGVDVRGRLLEWYAAHYSANVMKLAILSTQPLDELEALAIKHYSNVPNLNLKPFVFPVPSLSDKELQTEISYRTIKDFPTLRIEWPFPDQLSFWKSKPGNYLSHLVGHEGSSSCLAALKKKGWATSLSSSGSGHGAAGFETFRISIDLTALGLKNYKQVLAYLFAYLSIIRSTPPQEWVFHETATLGQISWRWREHGQPGPAATRLASSLHELCDRDKVLVAPWFATEFEPGLIERCAEGLTEERCRVFVGSKEGMEGGEGWGLRERYYGTEYSVGRFEGVAKEDPKELGMAMPTPNPFIPNKLDLVPPPLPGSEVLQRPSLIRQTLTSRLFFKQDTTWLIPRATAHFDLRSPLADLTPSAAVKTQIFTELVEEALADTTYDATLAGLFYSVGADQDGIQVVLGGYSEKILVLLDVVLAKIKGLEVDPTTFVRVHDRLCRAYANAQLDNPSQIADTYLRHLTRQTHWTYEERLAALQGLTPQDIFDHVAPLLQKVQIEALVHGNVTKEDALKMLKCVEGHLEAKAPNPAEQDYHRPLLLPKGTNHVVRPIVASPENVNSALVVYYQITQRDDHRLRMTLALFAQLAKVPLFSTLRTKEQLGYIVGSTLWSYNSLSGFRVQVQSERTAEYLEGRVEGFWTEAFGEYLEGMGEEKFALQRKSLVNAKLEKVKNLGQETSRYWSHIESGTLDFFALEHDASVIATLTKSDLITFFETFIHPSSPHRTKLSVLMRSQRLQPSVLEPALLALLPDPTSAKAFFATKPTSEELAEFVSSLELEEGPRIEVDQVVAALGRTPELEAGVEEIAVGEMEEFRERLERGNKVEGVEDFSKDLKIAHL